jgi:hypothetical protein
VEASTDVRALWMLVGLDIAPEYRAGVAAQFLALMSQADLVLSFPLPDQLEPAAVFLP